MQRVEIIDLCGEPPFEVRICDYSITTCYLVASGETSVPIIVDVPENLQNTFRVIVEVTDISGCTEFKYYDSTTPSPTITDRKSVV